MARGQWNLARQRSGSLFLRIWFFDHWPLTTDFPSRIKHFAREAGFDLCGIAPVREFRELEAFPDWIAADHHGEMKYMESRDDSGTLKRASLAHVAPWARSVIVCAINYNTAQPYSTQTDDPSRGWISRYAWSQEDYHDAVLRRLRNVEAPPAVARGLRHRQLGVGY